MHKINAVELPRVLAPAQAARLAITPARIRTEVRRGNWRRLATGIVLTRPDEPSRADWAEAGVALAGRGAAVTGWDALRAFGLGDRTPPRSEVVVLTAHGMNRVVGGVRVRRTGRPYSRTTVSAQSTTLPLTPVVSVPRAVADAALQYRRADRVRALVTSAVQCRACRLEDLLAELRASPRNGSHSLRLALADAVDGARSAAEARALGKLRRAPVPRFELNVPVVDERGRLIYVVDVLWRELRAVLEVDSKEFHLGEKEWKATSARHNKLVRYGLAVSHYAPSEIAGRGWIDEVVQDLRARAAELGLPYPRTRGVSTPPLGTSPPPYVVRTRR